MFHYMGKPHLIGFSIRLSMGSDWVWGLLDTDSDCTHYEWTNAAE